MKQHSACLLMQTQLNRHLDNPSVTSSRPIVSCFPKMKRLSFGWSLKRSYCCSLNFFIREDDFERMYASIPYAQCSRVSLVLWKTSNSPETMKQTPSTGETFSVNKVYPRQKVTFFMKQNIFSMIEERTSRKILKLLKNSTIAWSLLLSAQPTIHRQSYLESVAK